MKIWGGFAVLALSVSACGVNPLAGLNAKAAANEITVTSDRVVLRAPTGFCVDPQSSKLSAGQAFVVFGNCAAIAGDEKQPQPFVKAIVTATSLPRAQNTPAIALSDSELSSFFASNAGKAALSASKTAGDVEILDSYARNGAFFVHVRDDSTAVTMPGAANTYWRGYFDVKGSIVTISVLGLKDSPLSSASALQTLYDFGNAISHDQLPQKTKATGETVETVPQTGLLKRLFS